VGAADVTAVITARPEARADGPKLTDEMLAAIDDLMTRGEAQVTDDRAAAWPPRPFLTTRGGLA
jgi:hypothetical protein